MSEKRYRIDYSDKIIDKETEQKYYFEDMEDWKKIVNLLNEYEDNLQMSREKALYWRNKAENIFGDMKTNVELQQENIRLKKELKEMKDKAYHYGDLAIGETSSDFDKDMDELRKEIYGEKAEQKRLQELKKEIEEKRICKNIPIEERIIPVWKMPLK